MKFKITLLAFSTSIVLSLHAQNNWQKGYVVTNANDTLRGFIDQRDWTVNPTIISFRKTRDKKAEKFSTGKVNYFEMEGGVFYQRYIVTISMDEVGVNASEKYKNKSEVDTVFLQILQKGKRVTLLSYKDEIKNRFYIKNGNQNPVELIYQSYKDNGEIYTKEQYKTQLKFIAETSGTFSTKLDWLIKKSTYGNSSLLDVTSVINGIDAKAMSRAQKQLKTKPSFNVFFGAGLNVGMLTYQANSNTRPEWIRNGSVSRSTSSNPYVAIGFNFIGNPSVGRSVFRLDLSYNAAKFYTLSTSTGITSKEQIDYTFYQSTFSLTPQFIYNFYNKKNLKFFAGIGIRANYSSYQNNLYTITALYPSSHTSSIPDFFLLRKFWFSGGIETGVTINKKFEICISYTPGLEEINDNSALWYESINSLRLGVVYNFIRNKLE